MQWITIIIMGKYAGKYLHNFHEIFIPSPRSYPFYLFYRCCCLMCAECRAKGFLYFGIMNWTRANLHGAHKTRQTEHPSLNWITESPRFFPAYLIFDSAEWMIQSKHYLSALMDGIWIWNRIWIGGEDPVHRPF